MSVRVRILAPSVDRLLRLESEAALISRRMHRDETRRRVVAEEITRLRMSLSVTEAGEYERWRGFREADRAMCGPAR